jgi:hypothetical protein
MAFSRIGVLPCQVVDYLNRFFIIFIIFQRFLLWNSLLVHFYLEFFFTREEFREKAFTLMQLMIKQESFVRWMSYHYSNKWNPNFNNFHVLDFSTFDLFHVTLASPVIQLTCVLECAVLMKGALFLVLLLTAV